MEQTKQPPKLKTRLLVVDNVYFQSPDEQPTHQPFRWGRDVDPDLSPYGPKKVVLSQEWTPIDSGWLEDKEGLVVIENLVEKRQTIPSPEEKAELLSKVIEIGIRLVTGSEGSSAFSLFYINPGESFKASPTVGLRDYRLRCVAGTAKASITIYPR